MGFYERTAFVLGGNFGEELLQELVRELLFNLLNVRLVRRHPRACIETALLRHLSEALRVEVVVQAVAAEHNKIALVARPEPAV